MRTRIPLIALLALGLAGLGVGAPACVWTTGADVSDLSTKTCTFQGSDTACGQCVIKACPHELEEMCADAVANDAGTSVLNALDSCAQGNDVCDSLTKSAVDDASTTLITCLALACGGGTGACAGLMPPTASTNCPDVSLVQDTASDCGKCILSTCSAEVNNCCKQADQCSKTLTYFADFIGSCVQNPEDPCTTDLPGSSPLDNALLGCVNPNCNSFCTGNVMNCLASGATCSFSGESCCDGLTCLDDGTGNMTCGSCTTEGEGCDDTTVCCSGSCSEGANGLTCL